MRFKKLHFPAFGPFTDLGLALDREVGFHLFYGPNEAGKSSMLRGIRSLLFGVEHNTTDDFIHEMPKLRVGAHLVHSDGRELEFLRRKGRTKQLLDLEGNPLSEKALAPYLGGVDLPLFERLYGLDHRTLVEGGRALLEDEGDVGQSLFAAGLGPEMRQLTHRLSEEAAEVWRKRGGKKYALNAAIVDYKEAQSQIVALSMNPRDWTDLQSSISSAEEHLEETVARLGAARREQRRLERSQQAFPLVVRYTRGQKELESLPAAPRLAADFAERRRLMEREAAELESRLKTLGQKISTAQREESEINLQSALPSRAQQVEEVYRGLDGYVQLERRLREAETGLERVITESDALAADLAPGIPREEISLPPVGVRRLAHQLAADFDSAKQELENCRRQLGHKQQALSEVREQIGTLGEIRPLERLEEFDYELARESRLDLEIEETRLQLARVESELAEALASLPSFDGDLPSLLSMRPLLPETIDRYERAFDDTYQELKSVSKDLEKVSHELDALETQLERLKGHTAPPTRKELGAQRARRDQAYVQLRQQWEAQLSWQEAAKEWERLGELNSATDQLADRLFAQAERVTQISDLDRRCSEKQEQKKRLEDSSSDLRKKLERLTRDWRTQISAFLQASFGPKEFRGWLHHRDKVKNLAGDADRMRRELESRIQKRKVLLAGAEQVAKDFQQNEPGELGTVDGALRTLRHFIEPLKNKAARRERLLHDESSLKHQVGELTTNFGHLESRIERIRGRWTTLLEDLNLDPLSDPMDLGSLVDKYERLGNLREQEAQGVISTRQLRHERVDYEDKCRTLAAELGYEVALLPVDQLAQQLYADLQQSRTRQARLSHLKQQLEEWNSEAEALRDRERDNKASWAALLNEAGTESKEHLPEIEETYARRAELGDQLEKLEVALQELSGNSDLKQFCLNVSALDPDSLDDMVTRSREEVERLEATQGDLREQLGQLRHRQDNFLKAETGANEAAALAEEAASVMREQTERYMVLTLAHQLLQRQIEEYRRLRQGPILESTQNFFEKLTRGYYPRLETGYDHKDKPVLFACDKAGRKLGVEGLSDGTRDQLFLALRLATIEQQLLHHEPVPFVADDLLVHFDSERAAAALDLFVHFSQKTQVLFFTHLERDLQLASQLPKGTVEIHELGRALGTVGLGQTAVL